MLTQIKLLAALELRGLWGLNVLRFGRDPKARRKTIAMMAMWVLVIVMAAFYVGGLAYGLVWLGAGDMVPAYLITIASMVIFFFGIFKTGSILFRRNGYDILCALPLKPAAIVASRMMRMYVEDLALSLVVMVPGLAVWGWLQRPGLGACLAGVTAVLAVPLLPLAAASLAGVLVTAISSRMKHKSIAEALLSIAVVFGVLFGTTRLAAVEERITPEMLMELSETVAGILSRLYPPGFWLGTAVVAGETGRSLAFACLSLLVLAAVAAAAAGAYHTVCRRLHSVSSGRTYRVERMEKKSVLLALYKREVKRYFASGTYVTNTIIGPVMGAVLAGALMFVDLGTLEQSLPAELDLRPAIPYLLSGIFCLMTTTSVSISMEGKNWWIVKSLPLETRTILDAKLLLNLSLMAPFYALAQIFLTLALCPGLGELLWQLLIPAVMICFSCVYGIAVNLRLPLMEWESDVSVVKQSASSLVGGMGGFLLAVICTVIVLAVDLGSPAALNGVICAATAAAAALLYQSNCKKDLREI